MVNLRSVSNLHPVTYFIVISGSFLVLFDLLKKTVFRGAAWNYDYPAFTFVYDVPVMISLVLLMTLTVVFFPKLLALDRKQFVLLLWTLAVSFYALSFFALPEKSQYHAMTLGSGLYLAAAKVVEDGVIGYFSSFHSYGMIHAEPEQRWLEAAATLSSLLGSMDMLPGNAALADYAAEIKVQKHGPIPPLLVAPFLYLFGSTVGSAVLGSYAITSTLPVASYAAFREVFSETMSRIGALFVLVLPAGFIYVRKHTVGYDAIMAVLIAVTIALFLRAITDESRKHLIAAGIVFSLAFLSKLTAIPLVIAIVVGIGAFSQNIRDALTETTAFGISSLLVPISLLFVGYNFLIQYAFTFLNEKLEAGSKASESFLIQAPEPNLHNPVLNLFAVLYNIRWLGPIILMCAAIFVVYVIRQRRDITKTQILGIGFILSVLPFIPLIGVNLARQLLPMIVGITFVGLCGLDRIREWLDRDEFIRLVQVSIGITAATTLINL